MTGEFKILIFCVLIYLLQLPAGNALRCGGCTTEMKPECADAAKVTTFQTCNPNKTSVCRTVEHYNRRENRIHFSRSCLEAVDASNNAPCSHVRLSYFSEVIKCETCTTDYCNANSNLDVKKTKVEDKLAIPQVDEKKEKSFSTSLRSSFLIPIAFMFFSLYRTYFL